MYKSSIDELLNVAQEVSFGFNQPIYDENDAVESIYIVKEG